MSTKYEDVIGWLRRADARNTRAYEVYAKNKTHANRSAWDMAYEEYTRAKTAVEDYERDLYQKNKTARKHARREAVARENQRRAADSIARKEWNALDGLLNSDRWATAPECYRRSALDAYIELRARMLGDYEGSSMHLLQVLEVNTKEWRKSLENLRRKNANEAGEPWNKKVSLPK